MRWGPTVEDLLKETTIDDAIMGGGRTSTRIDRMCK